MADIERTPEQIDNMVTEVIDILSRERKDDNYQLFTSNLGSPAISEEFKEGARSAMSIARFEGILDGIRYTLGQGDLPDIEEMLTVRDAMAKYLNPSVLREVLGKPDSADRPSIIEGGS